MSDYWNFDDIDLSFLLGNDEEINKLIQGIGPDRKKTKEREL